MQIQAIGDFMKRLILIVVGVVLALSAPLSAQQASQNIPVLPVIPESSGEADWYLRGDGYLQRQVEPTIAVSTRNPDHLLSFFVDYRAVNIPDDLGLGEETQTFAMAIKTTNLMMAGLVSLPEIAFVESPPIAAAEAWVGGGASHDGGSTWTGFMMPGASFDDSLISLESPVYGLEAATDPVAVAGPCGYVYVAFMAFTRGDESKIVVARFQDLNDSESGKTWQYQGTWELESGNNALNGYFLDKTFIALDTFREQSDFETYAQHYPPEEQQCGHRLYVSYSTFNGLDKFGKFQSKLNFASSVDRGETWTKSRIQQPYTQNQGTFIAVDPRPGEPTTTGGGTVYVVWRHFFTPDAIVMIKTENYGKKFSKPVELTGDIPMQAFDQPTIQAIDGYANSPRELAFRSNGFPAAAVTAPDGTLFVAWQELVDIESLPEGADPAAILADPDEAYGRPDELGSPRIVMVKSPDGGDSFYDIYDNPGTRVAVDIADRDTDPDAYPPPGFGALPVPRAAGPQVKPWLSFGGGELALAFTESRGMYRRAVADLVDENGDPIGTTTVWQHEHEDLSPNGFISDIDRVMDFRVTMLDPSTGVPLSLESTQVSRYPISYSATFDEGDIETVYDVAPVVPELCDRVNGPPEFCQPSLNFVNKNHSGAGHAAFTGDYPGITPILPMIYDDVEDTGPKIWRWAIDPIDVPYPAFHVVFPDNRHLIPPVELPGQEEWERYPNYEFYPDPPTGNCVNPGSRNADVLTAKVNAELVLSAPTTYKQGSPGDPTWGYPISVFNQSDQTRFFDLTIIEGADYATFIVDRTLLEDPDIDPYSGVVEIFPYSSTSQMVYVDPTAMGQVRVKVTQVEWKDITEEWVPVGGGEQGFVTLNPDPSNPITNASEAQQVKIVTEGVEQYTIPYENLDSQNPFVRNPFVRNPFVRNPFVRNPFVRNTSLADVEVTDTTWSIQATAESGAGTYLPVINIDNADAFLKNYAFQLLIFKNAYHGTFDGCETFNVPHAQIISNVAQSNVSSAENPFVRNPFVRNPFVRNPFVRNPFVRNSAITVAPADDVTTSFAKAGAKNLIFDEDGTLRVPRVPEKIYITLRAFKLNNLGAGDPEYKPKVDEPAFTIVPTRCTSPACYQSVAPDLIGEFVPAEQPTTFAGNVEFQFPAGGWVLRNQGFGLAWAENEPLRHGVILSKDNILGDFDVEQPGVPIVDIPEDGSSVDLNVYDLRVAFQPSEQNPLPPHERIVEVLADELIDLSLFTEDQQILVTLEPQDDKSTIVATSVEEYVDQIELLEGQITGLFKEIVDGGFTMESFGEETFDPADVTIPDWVPGGTYYLFHFVDDFLEVSEFDEPNNYQSIQIRKNSPPIASDAEYSIDEDQILGAHPPGDPVLVYLPADDPDDDELTFVIVDFPSNGVVTLVDATTGQFTYQPDPNFNGPDFFTFKVNDGSIDSNVATVEITVNPVADYIFDGFFSPWRKDPPYSANTGSAIPLKWRYLNPADPPMPIESGDLVPSVEANGPFECGPPDYLEIDVEPKIAITGTPYDPGSSGLQYSTDSKEWQINWETDSEGAGCYYLRVYINHPAFSDEVSPPLLIILE
jgi:hypothetical protein